MEQKSWVAVGVLAAVVIIGAAIVSSRGSEEIVTPVTQQSDTSDLLIEEDSPTVPNDQSLETSTSAQPVVTATSTTAAPVTSTPKKAESGPATYTLAQVSTHASAQDCWTVFRGNVYTISSFVSRHPGGVEAIAQVCGRDGTAFFEDQHGGQRAPESVLASLKVGVLAK